MRPVQQVSVFFLGLTVHPLIITHRKVISKFIFTVMKDENKPISTTLKNIIKTVT